MRRRPRRPGFHGRRGGAECKNRTGALAGGEGRGEDAEDVQFAIVAADQARVLARPATTRGQMIQDGGEVDRLVAGLHEPRHFHEVLAAPLAFGQSEQVLGRGVREADDAVEPQAEDSLREGLQHRESFAARILGRFHGAPPEMLALKEHRPFGPPP